MLSGYDFYIRRVIENGKPIFPEAICITEQERLDALEKGIELESIERLKASTKAQFYGQYLNDPLDDALLEFKREWFQTIPEGWMGQLINTPSIISIDPAFRLSQSADRSGIVVTKTLKDNSVCVLDAVGIRANPQMLVEYIFQMVDRYQPVQKVLLETVVSQIMLMNLLQDEMKRRNKFFVLHEVKPESNENKAVRIRGLIPHYSNRRIFHAPHLMDLENELLEFPKGMHDDIIDALSYQVKFWRPENEAAIKPNVPEGSYLWWKKKISKPRTIGGKLFDDLRRPNGR